MSDNSFGRLFRFTTWGESHGPAIGCVIDGCPPGIAIEESEIQKELERRRPGQSRFTTQRKEPDQVRIMSGVFEGRTTGTPISLMIENVDQRSKDYGDIKDKFRPGHADIAYWTKYDAVNDNPLFCPDRQAAQKWEGYLDGVRKSGSSIGAVVEVVASGVMPGLGEPIYGKLDSDLAAAMMTINAVKGVEIGAGFEAAELSGEENADEIRMVDGKPAFLSNKAGGLLGGISTGQDIVLRFAVKPTSSILAPRKTIDLHGNETEIITKGRHDPCVGIRAVPVGEAMMALVLADHLLRHRGQCG